MVDRPEPVKDLDWEPVRARAFGEGVLDIWETFLAELRTLPVARRHGTEEVRRAVLRDVPAEPLDRRALLAYLREIVLEHSTYPGHPGFMAYVTGAGTVPGAAADLLAAAVNQNVGGWRLAPAATEIELFLLSWFGKKFGLGDRAGGLLTSGGAMANLIALKLARDAKAGFDVNRAGVAAGPHLALYASTEVHAVIERAAAMLGLGTDALRQVPVDKRFRMEVGRLEEMIRRDLQEGRRPIAVVASAGTVSTGAIDPLPEVAAVCAEHDLWFHVDGAYGAVAALTEELQPLFRGLEHADSIAFDPHKWLYTPHSGGALAVRDPRLLKKSFSAAPSYIHEDKALTRRGVDFAGMGPQFSRSFSALKIWTSLLAHGWSAYERRICHDVALARYLHERAKEHPALEPIGEPTLSIACFRYVPPDLLRGRQRKGYLNRLNERLMAEIQMDGRVYPSNAVLNGRFVLRACIVNFRTEAEQIDLLLEVAAELGAALDAELRPDDLRTRRETEGL